jgi:hypothetical protein
MDKRWYQVALSAAIVGCSSNVDNGSPGATGGQPNYHYGPALNGGAPEKGGGTSINTGVPMATGGYPAAFYGIIFITGGTAQTGGASVKAGTSSSIDGGTPAATGGMTPIAPPYGIYPAPSSIPPGK